MLRAQEEICDEKEVFLYHDNDGEMCTEVEEIDPDENEDPILGSFVQVSVEFQLILFV